MWGEYSDNYQSEAWENFQYNENIYQEPMEYCYNCQPEMWEYYQYNGNMSQDPMNCRDTRCSACMQEYYRIFALINHFDQTMGV